jgi:hypothetical protein
MFEANQEKMIGQEISVNPEQPLDEIPSKEIKENGYSHESAQPVNEPIPTTDHTEERFNQHAEAGRKGAQRIHQLIQHGRLYEREHGLKPGRQRLRQLIEEGKLYEKEHGLKSESKRARGTRRPRVTAEQLLKTLLQSLLRLAKPVHRSRILELVHALESEDR